MFYCALVALAEHFKARGIELKHWFFNTDGAPSHFKNRFTVHSLFTFKTKSGASTILWETCAPGHGKGPWDGVGAVVKRLLRQLERQDKMYANGAQDVFRALVRHDKHRGSSISSFVYHYILTADEPVPEGMTWSAIKRPAARPSVTSLKGIRSSFVFRVTADDVIAVRELSCRCSFCLALRWTECTNNDAGSWARVRMLKTAAATGSKTRSQRATESTKRISLARAVAAGEVIALESSDDTEGFSFWLALADGPAVKYTGETKSRNGVKFVKGGFYLTLRYYERFPPSSPSNFKLSAQSWTVDATGVMARSIVVSPMQQRRSARGRGMLAGPASLVTLESDQRQKLNDLPSLDSL